ncbi:MAG: hypothetical protein ACTSO9_21155 [Candidatus Helarchaeota archaeon]
MGVNQNKNRKYKQYFTKKATNNFRSEYDCPESVLMTILMAWELINVTAISITGFRGGIRISGSLYDSETRGIIVIRLKFGRSDLKNNKKEITFLRFYR